ncbi:microtubule organization protein AKNA [Echinops telfairi]|uniref:Microtubule organization protein AKNA n=1 Tax=Echinops telfairi TaxID=9371 RepID=A0AC55DLB9_ECHTE|nr:microtubule organization protein AKNA [Echinops telfairi]
MASSGTEVHWAEPGLGKGPRQRRRWAWAEEEKNATGSGARGWGDEPFPDATSPELLEDFRLAQQHPVALAWDPQAGGCQDSESEESAETGIEAEDVDSPESSNLPLYWFPQQDSPQNMTEEEPDDPQEVEETGERPPRQGDEDGLHSEGNGSPTSLTLGKGQARGWVASDKEACGDKPAEHSEVSPSIDLYSTRSWSSGTVSLGHPSDSLDSAWEGETHIPQPIPPTETFPQPLSCHLDPVDRTRGSVAQATPIEFHDFSPPPPPSLQCPGDGWRKNPSLSHPRPRDPPWKQSKIPPRSLPSRFAGSFSPLNPRPKPTPRDRLPRQVAALAGRSSDASKYGRGRLNYPLPDFSKVGPRVRFPKDESYQPPKAKSHSWQPQGPARPLIFKSPAEIVREVLLSSGEAGSARDVPPAPSIARVPQEFQTPEQATKLVHQLQEDYHKLLTKYAEAENTIDQLRLGAKVNLYSDPPQPRHSAHMGTVSQGTKVLSFTIPQPRTAEWQPGPAEAPQATEVSGWQSAQGELSPSSPSNAATPGWLPENQSMAKHQPSAERTQALASQASRFLAKVESFEGLVRAGLLTPQDQLKGFQWLKAAHAALEEEYLEACRDQHPTWQPACSEGAPEKFDPGRELEAEIFQLGIRLEEFKEHMEQGPPEPERAGSDSALDSPAILPPPGHPSPTRHAPKPTIHIQTSYPEPDTMETASCSLHESREVEGRPWELPAPLRHKELQMEQDPHGLLEQCLGVKSLSKALRVEEDKEEQLRGLEVDGPTPAPGKGGATRRTPRQLSGHSERSHSTPIRETTEQRVLEKPAGSQVSMARDGCSSGLGKAETAPPHPSGGTKSTASHQSSMTSLAGSGISDRLPQKSFRQNCGAHLEEPWMASPETDSGFVGSETSRVSPVTQTPEHRLSHISTPGTPARPFPTSVTQDGTSPSRTRGPLVPRTASEPSTGRSRAQKHLSSPGSPVQQEAPSFRLGRTLALEMAPSPELKGPKRISEHLLPKRAPSPPPTPASAAAPLTHPPTETPSLLLNRMGRDQAIQELQEEVSRLRLQLEDSLHGPARPASASNRPTRARARPADSSVTWGSHLGSKSTERLSAEPGAAEQAALRGRRRARSSSVPREVPQLSLTSESEPTSPRLPSGESRTSQENPRAVGDRMRAGATSGRPDRATFRGHYTGQEYHVLSPRTVLRGGGTASCPHCQPDRAQDPGGAAIQDPLTPSPADTPHCPVCPQVLCPPERGGPDAAASSSPTLRRTLSSRPGLGVTAQGADKATTRRHVPSSSSPKQRSKPVEQPAGLWYLAAAPPAPAPPAFAYVSSVPVVPYPPASVYYVSPGPTSARSAEWPPTASSQPPSGHRHSVQLDLASLEELNQALSRAVQAAKSVRLTTKQMSRSLSADLRQARSLRGSCLF